MPKGVNEHAKKSLENSVSKKRQFPHPKYTNMRTTLVQNIINKQMQHMAAKHVSNIMDKHMFPTGKTMQTYRRG